MTNPIGADLFRYLQSVSDPALSPDGLRCAYVLSWVDADSAEGRSRIYQVDAAGPAGTGLAGADGSGGRAFTQGDLDTHPRYSPDGALLAFLRADAAGVNGVRQVWLMPSDGGEAWRLTSVANGVIDFAWAPDSARLAVVADVCPDDGEVSDSGGGDEPRVREVRRIRYRHDAIGWRGDCHWHIFIVDVHGGAALQLTDGDWDDMAPAWSPDGGRIAFISGRSAERDVTATNEIYVVDVPAAAASSSESESDAVLPEAALWSEGLADVAAVSWAPDGGRLVAAGTAAGGLMVLWQAYLYVLERGRGPRRLTDDGILPCVGYPGLRWTGGGGGADGRILFPGDAAGETRLYALDVPSGDGIGELAAVTGGGELLSGIASDGDAHRIALVASGPAAPAELHIIALDGGAAALGRRRVTSHNDGWLAEHPAAAMEKFSIKRDGWDIECRLYHPPGFDAGRKYPLLLEVHGGPNGAFYDSFVPWHQVPATNGYLVLAVNPRGSSTYGEEFVNAVLGDWGGADYLDLMAAVDAVCARAYVDAERLGIHGYSYGGFMTAWAIGQTGRFRAAVAGAPCIDLWSMYGTSDIAASFGEAQWSARPAGGAEAATQMVDELAAGVDGLAYRLLQRSPITFAPQVTTPTLLLHGEADARCPIGQSEQYFQVLKRLGKVVEMARFPGCGHGFLRTGHVAMRQAYLERMMGWFARWV